MHRHPPPPGIEVSVSTCQEEPKADMLQQPQATEVNKAVALTQFGGRNYNKSSVGASAASYDSIHRRRTPQN